MTEERRRPVLTDDDVERIVEALTQPENIDKFASNFEARWRDYFYKGLGRGIIGYARKGAILIVVFLSAYGMAHNWNWPWK